MKTLKRFLPDLLVVLLFAVIAFAYFFPADTEGRILYRHDSSAGRGFSFISSFLCGSSPSAIAGRLSVSKLINSR